MNVKDMRGDDVLQSTRFLANRQHTRRGRPGTLVQHRNDHLGPFVESEQKWALSYTVHEVSLII